MLKNEKKKLDPKAIFAQSIKNSELFTEIDENKTVLILEFFKKAYYNNKYNIEKGLQNLLRDLV